VVVHFPDFLVAGVVVQLQIFFIVRSTALDAPGDIFVQINFPFAFGVTLRLNCFTLDFDFNFFFNPLCKWINTSERVFVFLTAIRLSIIERLINVISCFVEVNFNRSWLAIQVTEF